MTEEFKDVHQFDGTLSIPSLEPFTKENKLEQIKILIPKLSRPFAIHMLQKIGQALIMNNGDNRDDTNNVDATDLLANILSKDYENALELLDEQLEDMYNLGQCPQGRTTRLLQILTSM